MQYNLLLNENEFYGYILNVDAFATVNPTNQNSEIWFFEFMTKEQSIAY